MDGNVKLLTEQAFEALLSALRSGRMRSGSFVSVQSLSRDLGFPISAIREATKRAEAQGLLEILPKRGMVVMDAGPEVTKACMDMRAVMDKEGARRIVSAGDARSLRELAARHEDILQRARKDLTAELSAEALLVDLSLHDALSRGLRNPFLEESYRVNRNRIAIIQQTRPFLADRIAPVMEEHLEIIAALEAGDADRACAEIDRHYEQTLRWWGV